MITSFGNEFFRAEVQKVDIPDMFKIELYSKDDLIFTQFVVDKLSAISTAKTFVRQREQLHGK
tara:strand:+ start:592 stop:780 length:189 start_codon:yes stop_codon:yes gene_type:complete